MKAGDVVYLGRERGAITRVRLANNGWRVCVELDSSERVTCTAGPCGSWVEITRTKRRQRLLLTEDQYRHDELVDSIRELLEYTEYRLDSGQLKDGQLKELKATLEKL